MSEAIVSHHSSIRVFRTSDIRWSAIFGGWLLATAIAWLLYVFGLALGFSTAATADVDTSARAWGTGALAGLVLTSAVSMFLGGMFASWLDGKADRVVGTLHGIGVWALASTVAALLIVVSSSHALLGGAIFSGATSAALVGNSPGSAPGGTGTSVMGRGASSALQPGLRQHISQALAKTSPQGPATPSMGTTEQVDPQTTAAVAAYLLQGNTEAARSRLMSDTSLPQADADQVLQSMAAQTERTKAELKEAAQRGAKYLSIVMWSVFLCGAVGMVAAALGGWLGTGHLHRVYDSPPL